MDKFVAKVKECIAAHSLLTKRGKVVVAVSGGADSVALLSALLSLGYDCVAAHCNFHLRGAESMRDMRFVENLTERLGIDLYVKDFDVPARREATGESLEMACRGLRYEWFAELLDRDCAQAVAVGHHLEDNVETFFINALRGSGLRGLGGMRPRSGHVVRPLLECSRDEIEQYLGRAGLEWIVDSSNASDDFVRNRLRNRLIPLLEELFPGASRAILRTMGCLSENYGLYAAGVERRAADFADAESGEINIAHMLESEPLAPILLFEMLKDEGYNRRQTDAMLVAAARDGGTFPGPGSHVRELDHGILRAPRAANQSDPGSVEIDVARDILHPVRIEVTRHDVGEFAPSREASVAYIDESALEGRHRWAIRPWRRGDRMTPYGMNGSRLLSDIFAGAKLSAAQKQAVRLLTRDDEII